MIKQQINFYVSKAPPARDFWSLSSLILLFFLITFTSVFTGWALDKYADSKDKRLSVLEEQKESLPLMIAEEEAQRKMIKPNPELIAAQDRVKALIDEKRRVLGLLNQMQPNVSDNGFSGYLYGLASAAQKDTWVTAFDIDLPQRQFVMKGQAKAAENVPPMLNDLVVDSAFSGMKVTQLTVLKSEGNGHEFELNALLAGGDDE